LKNESKYNFSKHGREGDVPTAMGDVPTAIVPIKNLNYVPTYVEKKEHFRVLKPSHKAPAINS